MTNDNPFADEILPQFGTVRAPAAASEADGIRLEQQCPDLPVATKAAAQRALSAAATTPLLATVSSLLWIAGRFPDLTTMGEPEHLRGRVLAELRAIGTDPGIERQIRASVCYVLAATFDDLALNAAWDGADAWARNTLVSLLFSEAWGGERFFDLLEQLMRDPARHIDILELMAVCLAIGFQGKFRVLADGQAQLEAVRTELHRAIAHVRGAPRDPFRHGPCLAVPYRAPLFSRAALASAAAAALLTAGFCTAILATLTSDLKAAARDVSRLVPSTVPRLRPLTPAKPTPVAEAAPPQPAPPPEPSAARLRRLLAEEEHAQRLAVIDDGSRVIVRVAGAGLFASGKAALAPAAAGLMDAIAAAVGPVSGPLLVIGHADNQPIQTREFPSNTVLALKRAEAVAAALRSRLSSSLQVTSQSRGDSEPIASNATAEGRALNRRIEIVLPEDVVH
jgi:type VI secretion system protein ImpK